ncbi:MAG: DUF368 domain-containing protein [Candidatus Latescibacteria bacterium]|nr:DUF368 domain-containing protein [Candidatus Latescibacterota bacterium]
MSAPSVKRTWKDYILLALRGFCMGAADVVPGVSGGTMAFILGIYEELLAAIQAVNPSLARRLLQGRWREALDGFPWAFLAVLLTGILLAIATLAKGLSWALHHHPAPVWGFFAGLVLASIAVVQRRIERWNGGLLVVAALMGLALYGLVGLVPAATPEAPWFLILSGALASCAMILPGISGSFILVLLGKYHYILEAVVARDLGTLGLVALGCGLGLVSIARLLGWLLRRYHDITVAGLTGLLVGSLRALWPWKDGPDRAAGNIWPAAFNSEVLLVLGLVVLGCALVLGLDRLARRGG